MINISEKNSFDFKKKAEVIANLTQNCGHHSVWDEELLKYALGIVWFVNVKKVELGVEGIDKRLIKEEKPREFETLVIEAQMQKNNFILITTVLYDILH